MGEGDIKDKADEQPTAEQSASESPEALTASEAPEPPSEPALAPTAPSPPRVPWWPFLVYLGMWFLTTGLGGWTLVREGQGTVIDDPAYAYTVVGGVVLTMAGPLLVIAVWLTVWLKAGSSPKAGLLTSALVKGAIVTLAGVVLWWGMLIAVDAMRLGRVW